jgi:predicted ribosome quality control (RQC) complex YloA/Tae2 family protein
VLVKPGIAQGKAIHEETLQEAANLAAYYSHGSAQSKVPVMVASPKQIKKSPKGSPGAVLVMKQQRTLLGCPANALPSDTQQ